MSPELILILTNKEYTKLNTLDLLKNNIFSLGIILI